MDNDQTRPAPDPADGNTSDHPTPDDALEPAGDLFHPNRDEEKLDEDNDPPATPAPNDDGNTPLPADHPEFDYSRDLHEAYDAGEQTASGANDGQENDQDEDTPRPLEPQE